MLQYYDFNALTTGAAFPVASSGRFIYYLAGSAGGADSTIVVRAGNTGQSVLLKPGQSLRLADSDKSVDTWFISNYAKVQQILGTLLVGDGYFDDNRISGSVEVIDGGKNRTLAGAAFLATSAQAGVASKNSVVQLWNPAGSGKRLVLSAVVINAAASGYVSFWVSTVATTNLIATGVAKIVPAGGAVSVGVTRGDQLTGNPAGSNILSIGVQANLPFEKKFAEPVVLRPGAGLLIYGPTAADLFGSFEYFEESDS